VDIYWTASRFDELSTLPPVGKNISRQAVVPWRYHFNTGNSPDDVDNSHLLVYHSMVDVGGVGANARLDGITRDKSPSRMVCVSCVLTTGLATNTCCNKSSYQSVLRTRKCRPSSPDLRFWHGIDSGISRGRGGMIPFLKTG
jgi:hypothetical protein